MQDKVLKSRVGKMMFKCSLSLCFGVYRIMRAKVCLAGSSFKPTRRKSDYVMGFIAQI